MQQQESVWKPICYGSHKWSSAAQNWAVIQKELYGIFSGITNCSSYLLGRPFILATDHRNLVYLKTSKIPKLVRWYLALSEFQFVIIHVAGEDNVIADVLSRFYKLVSIESQDYEVHELLTSFHNSDVGHLGSTRLVKTFHDNGIEWTDMRKDIEHFVSICPICQKLKRQKQPVVVTEGYTVTSTRPMECVSADSIGPLTEDAYGNKYILHFMCAFSKFNMLIATKTVDADSYVHGLMIWVGLFGVPSRVRTDGGTQFTANVCQELIRFLGISYFTIIPYHPQANGDNERWNAEIVQLLRALVLERRIKDVWSDYLPIVQRILNSVYTSSLGTFPARVVFGDNIPVVQPYLLKKAEDVPFQPISTYVMHLNDNIQHVVNIIKKKFETNLQLRQQKMQDVDVNQVVEFKVGEFVLVTYPSKRPSKLCSLYRGPMKIVNKMRDDIFEVLDLVSGKIIKVHVDRLRVFKYQNSSTNDESMLQLATSDVDEFIVNVILAHRYVGSRKTKSNLEFLVSWDGYEDVYNSWEPYDHLKDVQALDGYSALHPELKLK